MNLFSNTNKNVFSAFIGMLDVKYTQLYADKLYHEHPYKYSLYGLSKMLSEYNIENEGVKIFNKEEGINALETPFIAHAGNEFVAVFEKNEHSISYIWQDKRIDVAIDKFLEIWSGVVLLAEPDERSVEPNYVENRKKEWLNKAQISLLLLIFSGILLFSYVTKGLFANLGLNLSLLLNLVGVYVCLLLTLKQMRVQSSYADKLCSLFKKSDCNNILESEDAKLWGLIGWSEIGLGYFISNSLIVLWFPQFMSYLSLIGCGTLIFSFWSIWYQKVKVGQWCPLCLIVQLLFWLLFFVNITFGFITIPSFAFDELFVVGCLFLLPMLLINIAYPKLEVGRKVQNILQEMNSVKMRDEVISALLKKQPFHQVDFTTSKIVFGNPQAKICVTILTNPHCEPCGVMHKRVGKLLDKMAGGVCVQYVFSSFDEELEISNKQLIAIYLNSPMPDVVMAYNDWFEKGKYQKEDFFKRYPQNIEECSVETEFEHHKIWKEKAGLSATPTVLVNGYVLPRDYRIEDISYFTEIDVNSIIIAKP